MMTLQARELLSQPVADNFRAYPVDSPRAKARLLVLALLADGELAGAEMASLRQRGALRQLGIDRDGFYQVLHDFCTDAARLPSGAGNDKISPTLLGALFAEVRAADDQQVLLRLILDVIVADGRIAAGEAHLLSKLLDAWDAEPGSSVAIAHRRNLA